MKHSSLFIGDKLPVEVVEQIFICINAQSEFFRARSVSQTWFAVADALIKRKKLPLRTFEERVRFAEFKFLASYRHLLDESPVAKDTKKTNNKKKHKIKLLKKKEKKSKKENKIQSPEAQEPAPQPGYVRNDAIWLKKRFELVLLSLPTPAEYYSFEKEIYIVRIWLFAEEEEFIRKFIVSSFTSMRRIPFIGGYFSIIGAPKFFTQLENDLRAILYPHRHSNFDIVDNHEEGQHININIMEMTRDVVTAATKLFKLLPSKIVHVLKMLYHSSVISTLPIMAIFFQRFIIPGVIRMFDPTKQKQKKVLPSVYNKKQLNTMALLIQGSLAGSRMIQSYRESVQLAEEVKNIIVPAFEELMETEIDMNEVCNNIDESGQHVLFTLRIAPEILN